MGTPGVAGAAGATNTGSGGTGGVPGVAPPAPPESPGDGGIGGSGIVIIRGPSAVTFAVTPGTNSTSTHPGGDKIATFTVSGTLTIS